MRVLRPLEVDQRYFYDTKELEDDVFENHPDTAVGMYIETITGRTSTGVVLCASV